MKRTTVTYVVAILAICALGALALSGGPVAETGRRARPEGGVVVHVAGQVDVVREADGAPRPLLERMRVYPGDRLVTGTDGHVGITVSGRRLEISETSDVALGGRDTGTRVEIAGIRVARGRVQAEVNVPSHTPFEIETSETQLRTTRASIQIDRRDGVTEVGILDGSAVLNSGDRLAVGDRVRVDAAGRLARVTRLPGLGTDGAATRSPGVWTPRKLKAAVRDLNPEIYLGVDLELAGLGIDDRFEPSKSRIRRIRVRSTAWDRLRPADRVNLLNDTYDVLRSRYPGMDASVVLEFDDARPPLHLNYALSRAI